MSLEKSFQKIYFLLEYSLVSLYIGVFDNTENNNFNSIEL